MDLPKLSINQETVDIGKDRLTVIGKLNATGDLTADDNQFIGRRTYGAFEGKALWLDRAFDYMLGIDEEGETILVPLKKIKKGE